ncbi:MAG: hypothetical protein LC659_05340 [Myxococcales bacterium]|nr:hypothetical protein [Myxococcales bacterium]
MHADSDELGLEPAVAHAWDLSWITVGIALVGGVALLREGFAPLQGGTAPARDSLAGQPGGELELTRDLGRGFFLFGSAGAAMYVFSTETTDFAHAVVTTVKPAGIFSIGFGMQLE